MDRRSRKRRGPSSRRRSGSIKKESAGSRRHRRELSPAVTSSFSIPLPSRATIKLSDPKQDRAIWLSHLFGLLGVCLLILMGGSHNVYVSGAALLLPGIALVFQPPRQSPGKWVDIGILGFLGSLLFAFIPLFYWSTPGWREAAVSAFGIDLPSILSVQPRISFEAWLMVVAGFAWFYAASGWRINSAGRKWLMAALAGVVAVFSAWVIWGNLHGLRYPGAEDSRTFSFFPNRNQTANFLAIGGIVSFGFAMEGLRGRKAIHLIGLLASGLCLGALLLGASRAGLLLYFLGVLIWFLARLRATSIPVFFKVGFPLVLLAFSFFISSNEQATARVVDFFATPFDWSGEYRALVYRDTVKMIGDAPITGIGIGNFSAVFPQYRELSRNFQQVMHPESDFFWLAAEGGLVAVVFFCLVSCGLFYPLPRAEFGAERILSCDCIGCGGRLSPTWARGCVRASSGDRVFRASVCRAGVAPHEASTANFKAGHLAWDRGLFDCFRRGLDFFGFYQVASALEY